MKSLDEVIQLLKNVKINAIYRNNNFIFYYLEFYNYYARIKEDEESLNKLWCLKSIFFIQKKYVEAFINLKNSNYYEAWCLLGEIEGIYNSLINVYFDESDEFSINFIYEYVKKFQKFFPYKLFLSPEFHVKKFKCNICGETYTFRKKCKHKIGKLYNGKMCRKIIEEGEIISISFVNNPVQKYSVVFPEDDDTYNYDLIKSHISNLDSPFHKWNYEICKKLEPHSSFESLDKNDDCPCGSGESYEDCCLKKEGVIIPYFNVDYELIPSRGKFENFIRFQK